MKKYIFLLLSLLICLETTLSQNCIPSDNCATAPKICLQGYLGTTAGYTPSNNLYGCPNGQQWAVNNDQWIAFTPTQADIIINVEMVGNCSSGAGIQALIHSDCNSNPIDCDVDCNGDPSVGAGVSFVPGQTYYLRIDGCSGAICPIKITYSPDGAIETPPDPFIPKWQSNSIAGPVSIDCPGKIVTFSAPFNNCATAYHWKIESGQAQILNDHGVDFTDNDTLKIGTDVTIKSTQRHIVRIKFTGTTIDKDSVLISCEGTNGCYTTGKTVKKIYIKSKQNINKIVKLCPTETGWTDPNMIYGGPYLPSDTCGVARVTQATISSGGCEYDLNVSVTRLCDTSFNKDLGLVLLCPGEALNYCGQQLDSTTLGIHTIRILATPKQDANLIPPSCDSTIQFKVEQFLIKPILNCPDTIKLSCQDAKYLIEPTLDIGKDVVSLGEIYYRYRWQKYLSPSVGGTGWSTVQQNTTPNFVVKSKGLYRLSVIATIEYEKRKGNFGVLSCDFLSKTLVVEQGTTQVDSTISVPKPDISVSSSQAPCSQELGLYKILNFDSLLYYNVTTTGGVVQKISNDSILIRWEELGTQKLWIQATAFSDKGCNSADSIYTIDVLGLNKPEIIASEKVCQLTTRLSLKLSQYAGSWKQIGGKSTAIFENPLFSNTNVTVGECGIYTFVWEEKNGICAQSDTISIYFDQIPTITWIRDSCTNKGSQSDLKIQSCGSSNFVINGVAGTLVNDTFRTDFLPFNKPVQLSIINKESGCFSSYSSPSICNCNAFNAGTMDTSTIEICLKNGIDTFKTFAQNFYIPTSGTREYILTDKYSNGKIGTILQRNKTGTFTTNSLLFYTDYYVLFVVGFDDGLGYVDLTSECVNILSRKVRITGRVIQCTTPLSVCGLKTTLTLTPVVKGNWQLIKAPVGGVVSLYPATSSSTIVSVTKTGEYTLQWISNEPTCPQQCEVVINFYKRAPIADSIKYECSGGGMSYVVLMKLSGKAPFKLIKGSTKGYIVNDYYISTPVIAGNSYVVRIADSENCDTLLKTGNFYCPENETLLSETNSIAIPKPSVSLFPNPASDKVTIRWQGISNHQGVVELWDMRGQLSYIQPIQTDVAELDLSTKDFPVGSYIVRLRFNEALLQDRILIVRE